MTIAPTVVDDFLVQRRMAVWARPTTPGASLARSTESCATTATRSSQ